MAGFIVSVVLLTSLWICSTHQLIEANRTSAQEDFTSRLIFGTSPQNVKAAFVIYEESHALMFDRQCSQHKFMMMYTYQSFPKFLRQQMKQLLVKASVTNYHEYLSFILMCGKTCIEDTMNHAMELDNSIGLRSLLRHFSTWTLVSHDQPPHLNITLDHVALMRIDRRNATRKAFRNSGMDNEMRKDYSTEVYTLLWMQECREWSRVYPSVQSDDQLFISLFPNILRGLNGRQLIISTLEWPPDNKRQFINGKIRYVGPSMDIIDYLSEKFNFSYIFVEPSDILWGQEMVNGSWTGVLGMIQRAEADMCVTPYGLSQARKKDMDFSYSFDSSDHTAIYKRRSDDVFSWIYLSSSFTWQVYLCVSAALLWAVLLFVFIQKKNNLLISSDRNRQPASWFEIGISAPLRQATIPMSENSSVKLLAFSCYLFCLVMASVYTGNLVAIMAVERYNVPFDTLQELGEQDAYEVGTFEGTMVENILKASDNPVYKLLNSKLKIIKSTNNEYSSKDVFSAALSKVLKEKFVLIVSGSIENYINSQTCDLVSMKERFLPFHAGFPFPRNSPIKKLFDNQIFILKESGFIDKWISKWVLKSKPLDCAKPEIIPRLKIDHLKSIIALCSGCVVLATIVLLVERIKKKCQ